MTALKDRAARETITRQVDRNLFVEAGAGSGKTFLLVQRLLTLIVDEGVPLARIAAITFTEKAAAELVSRLRTALNTIAAHGELEIHGSVRTFDAPQARERAREALAELPGAAIETLHSFCLRLIQTYPFEVGVPPLVEKSTELRDSFAASDREVGVLALINDVLDGDAADEEIRALDCGVSPAELRDSLQLLVEAGARVSGLTELAGWMDQHWGELTATSRAPLSPAETVDRDFLTKIAVQVKAVRAQCTRDEDKLAVTVSALIDQFDQLLADPAVDPATVPVLEAKLGSGGTQGAWGRSGKEVRDEIKEILGEWAQRRQAPFRRALTVLRRALAAVVLRDAEARKRTGSIEYHDMIYLADALLADERVRRELHEKFHALCIDEFQDTDPAQLRIVRAIAGDGGEPAPGRLFTVGDPKQSIYRFRRADIDTYLRARPDGEELVKLTTNFRSEESVINHINLLFQQAFAAAEVDEADELSPRAVPYDALDLRPAAQPNGGSVVLLHDAEALADGVLPEAAIEQRDIIAAIRAIHAGHPRVSADCSPTPLRDIAVLVSTHRVARNLMSALDEEGIPYVSEGSTRAYSDPVIEELVCVLRATADPADNLAEAAALRTASVGCSDNDLAEAARARHTGRELAADHPAVRGRALLNRFRAAAAQLTVAELVDLVVEETGLYENLAAIPAEDELTRLRFVQDNVRTFSRETGLGLRAFVRWADEQSGSRHGVNDPILNDGADGVRIMTVHASKGREFPAVILAGMCGQNRARAAAQGFHPGTGVVELSFSGCDTPDYEEFRAFDKASDEAETIRQLYVAATRAESTLVIPLEIPRTGSGRPAKRLGTALLNAAREMELEFLASSALDAAQARPIKRPEVDPEVVEKHTRLARQRRTALAERAWHLPRLKATAVVHSQEAAAGLNPRESALGLRLFEHGRNLGWYTAREDDAVEGVPLGASGPDFGTAVHEVMERIDAEPLSALAKTVAGLNGLSAEDAAVVAEAASILADSPAHRAATEAGALRELPVVGLVDGVAVEGVIDLLHRDADSGGWVIVDYKTDGTASAETVTSYFAQLSLYARLLDSTAYAPVTTLRLVFARRGRAVTRTRVLDGQGRWVRP